jgi:glycine/D-amino acid oxidase-like deaminating enzyme
MRDNRRSTPEVAWPSANETTPIGGGPDERRKRIVIVGCGFAGIAAARALKRCEADVVLIDRRNHHIFQPLLYQVATSVLAPSDIAAPIRQLADEQKNVSIMLAEVTGVAARETRCQDYNRRQGRKGRRERSGRQWRENPKRDGYMDRGCRAVTNCETAWC